MVCKSRCRDGCVSQPKRSSQTWKGSDRHHFPQMILMCGSWTTLLVSGVYGPLSAFHSSWRRLPWNMASALLLWVGICWGSSLWLIVFGSLPTPQQVCSFPRGRITAPPNMRPQSPQLQPRQALARAVSPPGRGLGHGERVGDVLPCNGDGEPASLVYKPQRAKASWLGKAAPRGWGFPVVPGTCCRHGKGPSAIPQEMRCHPWKAEPWRVLDHFPKLLQGISWRCPGEDPQGNPPSHWSPQNPLEGLLPPGLLGPHSRVSQSLLLGWSLRMFVSDKF